MTEFLNHYGGMWLGHFTPAVLQNTVFLAMLLALLYRLRRRSASLRYTVGLVGLVKLALPPFLSLQAVLPAPEKIGNIPAAISAIPFIGRTITADAAAASKALSLNAAGLAFALWGAGAIFFIVFSLISTARLFFALRGARPVGGSVGFRSACEHGVRIMETEKIAIPLTFGLFPKKIFVPPAWHLWSPECRRMVVHHELAHIRRRDGIIRLFQILIQALYLFHPLVWILNRFLGRLREMACDDETGGAEGCSGLAFSRYLVEIAETTVHRSVSVIPASALMWHRSELFDRVRYQMTGGGVKTMSVKKTVIAVAALVLMALPFSWYYGEARPGAGSGAAVEAAGDEQLPKPLPKPPAPPAPAKPVSPAPANPAPPSGPALPAEAAAPAPPAPPGPGKMKTIEVSLYDGRNVRVEGEDAAFEDLRRLLGERAGDDREKAVVKIVCNPGVVMRDVYDLQAVLRRLDLMKVSYVTEDGKTMPHMLPPGDVEEHLKELDPGDIAVIKMNAGGLIGPEGITRGLDELEGLLRRRVEDNPRLVVRLLSAPDATFASFLDVMERIQEAGAKRLLIEVPEADREAHEAQ